MAKKKGFRSKAQWRWSFVTKKPWARKWAHETRNFKSLPARKGARKKV